MNEITFFRNTFSSMFGSYSCAVCAKGLHRYVSVPASVQKIVFCFTKQARKESFEIELDPPVWGRLVDHPRIFLMSSFASELRRQFDSGYKFFHIEY